MATAGQPRVGQSMATAGQLRVRQLPIVEGVMLPPRPVQNPQSPRPLPTLVLLSPPVGSRIRRPDKLPPPRYLRAQNRSDAAGSGYAIAPSSLSSRSSKDSRSDISSPLAAASSASSSRQRSLSSSAPKTRSQLGEAVQACGDVLVLLIVREVNSMSLSLCTCGILAVKNSKSSVG
ncbi:unnamed protein product [Alopecurus aequalis]